MPARKQVRRIAWGRILAPLLVVSLVAGWYASPVTGLANVRVVNARPEDRRAVEDALKGAERVPFPRFNSLNVESLLLNVPGADRPYLARNPLRRGTLQLRALRPALRLPRQGLILAESGDLYRGRDDALPRLLVPDNDLAGLGAANDLDARAALEVLAGALARFAAREIEIVLEPTGGLCLNTRGCRIELGDRQNLEAKFAKLDEIQRQWPDWNLRFRRVVLVVPERPAAQLREPSRESVEELRQPSGI